MKKHLSVALVTLLLVVLIAPSATLAAWWNPFTWAVFHGSVQSQSTITVIATSSPSHASSTASVSVPAQAKSTSNTSPKPVVQKIKSDDTTITLRKVSVSFLNPKYQEQYQIKLVSSAGSERLLDLVLGGMGYSQSLVIYIPENVRPGDYQIKIVQVTNGGKCDDNICAIGKTAFFTLAASGSVTLSDQVSMISVYPNNVSAVAATPVSSPGTPLNRNLTLGDSGSDVTTLQNFLQSKGLLSYGSYTAGIFDQQTQSAVSRYQSMMNIPSTGYVGPITINNINVNLTVNQTVNVTQTVNQVNVSVPVQPSRPVVTPPTTAPTPKPLSSLGFTVNNQKSATIGDVNLGRNPVQTANLRYYAPDASYCVRKGPGATWESDHASTIASVAFDSVSLPIGTNTFSITCYTTAGESLTETLTITVNPLPEVQCPQSTTFNGVTYSLEPCSVETTMVHGQGNRAVSTNIMVSTSTLYGFTVYGYGIGFPTYGVSSNTSSGGAQGNEPLSLRFIDSYLPIEGGQAKTYSGYIPIDVDDSQGNTGHLYLKMKVTVTP